MNTFKCIGPCGLTQSISNFGEKPTKLGHNKKCRKCVAQYQREYYASRPEQYEKHKQYVAGNDVEYGRIRYRHGMTEKQFKELFSKFDGACWICKGRLATQVDHDHACCPGVFSCGDCVRGALCKGCNIGIGLLQENVDIFNAAVLYLAENKILHN